MKDKLEEYAKNLSNIGLDEFKDIMNRDSDLTREEKCYLYYYLFPRPLLDRELPVRINLIRGENKKGSLIPSLKEICILIEACRTLQYSRFMKHVLLSFTDVNKIFPATGEDSELCPICGKRVFKFNKWESICQKYQEKEESNNKEFLAFGSTESRLLICLDCIIQLKETKDIIDKLDPSFLDWKKNYSKQTKLSWENLKP